MYETRCQSRFNARCWMLGAGALGRPRGMVWGGGGRGVWDGEHMCACGGFILMFGKTSAIMYGKKNKKIKKKLKKKKKKFKGLLLYFPKR